MTFTPEQIVARRSRLHASEWASAIGASTRFATAMDVYAVKLNLVEPNTETPLMHLGTLMEPVIYGLYLQNQHVDWDGGVEVYNKDGDVRFLDIKANNTLWAPVLCGELWAAGTPDCLVEERKESFSDIGFTHIGGAEFKYCRSDAGWGEPPDGDVPIEYEIQCRIYMALVNVDWWDLVPLFRNEDDVRIYRLHRDSKREAELLDKGHHFWFDHVLKEIPPEPVPETPPRTIAAVSGPENGEWIQGNGYDDELAWAYKRALVRLAKTQRSADKYKAKICARIGPASGIEGPGYRFPWKTNKRGSRVFKPQWEE